MNYRVIYERLVDRARHRVTDVYTEKHHVIPRCMGGTDERANLVRLTPEEHFLAHQLLVKLHPENDALVFALNCMIRSVKGERANNRMFGWMRRRVSEAMRDMKVGIPRSPEVRAKLSAANMGRPLTLETRAKMSVTRKGRKHSPEHRAAISAGLVGKAASSPANVAKFLAFVAAKSKEDRTANALKAWATRRSRLAAVPAHGN